jgi:periplasmic protein TonB
MESSTILTADVLDIIFEGRNKDYGAYDLRRTYNRRLTVSITVMLSVICMLTIGYAFAGKKSKADPGLIIGPEITLESAPPKEKPVEPPPPPPMKPPAPPVQVKMKAFVAPKIVQDDQVKPEEMPPVNATLEDVKIGNKNVLEGLNDDVVAPPIDGRTTGVIEAPKRDAEDADAPFISVQIESEYPGGMPAWERFLNRNLRYPQEALDQGIQGFVTVQFIVDKEGNVSDVIAVSGPTELQAEAIRVIKKSGKWTPAVQNGRHVKSYKKQPIGFKFNDE